MVCLIHGPFSAQRRKENMKEKFCGECGARLDEATGLCPKCDAEKLRRWNEWLDQPKWKEQPEAPKQRERAPAGGREEKKRKSGKKETTAQKKARKREQRAQWSTGKKVRSFLLKLLGILLALAVLAAAGVCALVYFDIVDIPFVSEILENIIPDDLHSVEKDIPETDTTGFVFYQSSEENIAQDSSTGISFINNEILVFLISENYRSQLEDYLSVVGGRIVGEISELAEYQILLEKDYTYAELQDLAADLEQFDWVRSAAPNYLMDMDESYIPNDKKWKNKWSDIPEGNNWGMEAINAPGAWEYQSQMKPVNIGILDDMFDVNHEDLNFAEMPLGSALAASAVKDKKIKWSSHGTHTSGTIAATFDNDKGVSGVSIKTNLYGVSSEGLDVAGKRSSQAWNIALYYLIAKKRCSVINISMGFNQLTFEASRKETAALAVLEIVSQEIEKILKILIEEGYQFVICKSSGNQNEVGGGYQYFKKDADDEADPSCSYYFYKDYEKYLNGDKTNEAMFSRYKNRKKEIQGRLESGNVDAKYDVLGAISDESVRRRIIMVGAAQNLGTHKEGGFFGIGGTEVHDGYKVAPFSQCGKVVDVIAPGVDIYSTIRNGYKKYDGTSMAAPHVAGVAGLIFSVRPDIDADKVKEIIRDTATGEYGKEKYGLVNAEAAVEAALNYKPESSEDNQLGQFDKGNVPVDAVEFDGHYYYLFDTDSVTTWNEAKDYCESLGGYLAAITSQQENDFLYDYICQRGYESAYFGLTDAGSEGTWSWCNGEPVSYVHWASGEPNNEGGENYGMFYWKYPDATWNDGDFGSGTQNGGKAFICEWGEYTAAQEPERTTSGERDIVLVLDVSGSMAGSPMEETKKASVKFIDTILDEDASIGIVTYDDSASMQADFSADKAALEATVSGIYDGGSTNIEAGLAEAEAMLRTSGARKKIIVLMSDGEPNAGKEGDELIAYADSLKEKGIIIYTLGFFESLGGYKSYAQTLMEGIASDGCHYEVASADDLVFFFEDMADQINGQKYIYIRIACPVDVTVAYNGEILSSEEDRLNVRTEFGTLTFEEREDGSSADAEDRIKVLRLKEGAEYDVRINGTGRGLMDYTIGFMDENGEYSDFRRFEKVKITRKTKIDTVAAVSETSVLNIDEDGDGRYDLKLRAEENGYGEEVDNSLLIYAAIGGGALLLVVVLVLVVRGNRKKRKTER